MRSLWHILFSRKLQDTEEAMSRLTAKDFPQELLELYDYYAHGRITKREFLDRAGKFAVGGVTAATILSTLSPDYALAQQVEFTDPDIVAEYITFGSPKAALQRLVLLPLLLTA
jgi:hypothetical protein